MGGYCANWISKDHPLLDASPDGTSVLISQGGTVDVWFSGEDRPPKRLRGEYARFSPSGQSAVSVSKDTVYWWNTTDWQLHRSLTLSKELQSFLIFPSFLTDDILVVGFAKQFHRRVGRSAGEFDDVVKVLIVVRNRPEPIEDDAGGYRIADSEWAATIRTSLNGRLLVIGSHIYDVQSGQRLFLPRGHRFQPQLDQFTDDGRFALLPWGPSGSLLVDLAADKQIGFNMDARLLTGLQTWVGVRPNDVIVALRKTDATLDAEILQTWCQVIVRGKLDEGGRFSKFDEATWEKSRLELARLLDANPNAQSLRSAVTDRLYWLRQEIKDLPDKDSPPSPLLLDRLIAADRSWSNFRRRAAAHAKLSTGTWPSGMKLRLLV